MLQVVSDFIDLDGEFELMHTMAARSGRPISISVAQSPVKPDIWRALLDRMSEATAAGVTMRGQVGARAVGLLLGFEATLNPFMWAPAWAELAAAADARARRGCAGRTFATRCVGDVERIGSARR